MVGYALSFRLDVSTLANLTNPNLDNEEEFVVGIYKNSQIASSSNDKIQTKKLAMSIVEEMAEGLALHYLKINQK